MPLVSMTSLGGCLKNSDQKIAFRVDASLSIGTGHLMRCLTLADELKQRGAHSRFISRHMPGHLRDMLVAKGHEFKLLDTIHNAVVAGDLAHAEWLGVTQGADAKDTIHALSDQSWDWLVVDHYALDAYWESALRNTARQIMVIDDIADRQHDCDILLDQNFYPDMDTRYTGKVPVYCRLLLGPRYALLRGEFRQLHEQIKPRSGPVKRILVFFGGVDADNYTGHAVEALTEIEVSGLQVDVVIGSQHPCRVQIQEACAQHGFICHVQTDKMAELMAAADLAIGAGGSATWERCCLGLPALSICVAANQLKQIADAAQEGLMYAPQVGEDLAVVIKNHTIALLENEFLRKLISRRAMQAVDGRGVLRIIGILGCNRIEMRMANADDSAKLFEWRNHPSIRSVSRNTEPITWENHQKWFDSVISSKDRLLLIGQKDETAVGVVRFDKQEGDAEVSIYLVPDASHSGQGRNLLMSAEQWLKVNRHEIKNIRASVLDGNESSQRMFLGAGYQVDATLYLKKL
jgi:UDP-2,4-diacetamido-2,4,6-trideoxy-beta-L-altropyranose hydrolase